MEIFKILLVTDNEWVKQQILLWLEEDIFSCKYKEIPLNQVESYDAVILDCELAADENLVFRIIMKLKYLKQEILILVIGENGSVQERSDLLKAGANDILPVNYSSSQLKKRVVDLKYLYWYKNWKKTR